MKASPVEDLVQQELSILLRGFILMRLALIPVPVFLGTYIVTGDSVVWRRWAIIISLSSMVGFSVLQAFVVRRGHVPRDVGLTLGVAIQLIILSVTGGIESPVMPTLIIVGMIMGLFASRSLRLLTWAVYVVVIWGTTILAVWGIIPDFNPDRFGGGSRAGHNDAHLWISALTYTMFISVTQVLGAGVRRAYDRLRGGLAEARGDTLQSYAEQAQLITTMSAEIAHELKNPLASVKGLASLAARELDGKNAERMTVLRREVDRMQGILDELLNFSRPLVPLQQGDVDLAELCSGVVALHEGVLGARRVAVNSDGPARIRCDARKVKQIVINLLQNALDASPPDGEVELRVRAGGLSVLDRGAGLPPDLEGTLFEPGVTTKPSGSGLGLTVARALARQHGGELSLAARPGGGCEAVLTLQR